MPVDRRLANNSGFVLPLLPSAVQPGAAQQPALAAILLTSPTTFHFLPVQAMPSASPSGKPTGAPAAKQGGASHNAAQYSPEQLAFLKRTGASVQGTAAAPKPAAQPARRATSASPTPKPAAGGASAQYTPEQLEFLRRKGISPEVGGCASRVLCALAGGWGGAEGMFWGWLMGGWAQPS